MEKSPPRHSFRPGLHKEVDLLNIGIRLHDTAPGTLEERLGYAKQQGFSCIHLALHKTEPGFTMDHAPELLTDALAARLQKGFSENGLTCAVLGCYLNLADPDPAERERLRKIYRAHLRFAPKMNALLVGTETHAAKNSQFAEPAWESEEAFQLFMEGLRPIVRDAEEADALLAVEPVHDHIISTVDRAVRMLEMVPSDHLRIILDPVNLISPEIAQAGQADAVIEDAIRRLGDKVCVLHMKDYVVIPGKPKVHSQACGTGVMHYETLLRFAMEKQLPMTLEDTTPENAEQARLHLEEVAARIKA